MREFTIKVTINKDGIIHMEATNDGFNAMELLGLLEMKKMDIIDQCINPEKFKMTRKCMTEDGEWNEIVKDGE